MTMERWKEERLLKKAKKQARKQLIKEGHHPKTAAKLVNNALKRIYREADNDQNGGI